MNAFRLFSHFVSLYLQNATVEDEGLSNGDVVIIEEGRLPPKVRLYVSPYIVYEVCCLTCFLL